MNEAGTRVEKSAPYHRVYSGFSALSKRLFYAPFQPRVLTLPCETWKLAPHLETISWFNKIRSPRFLCHISTNVYVRFEHSGHKIFCSLRISPNTLSRRQKKVLFANGDFPTVNLSCSCRFNKIAHTRETMNSDGLNTLKYTVERTEKFPLYTKITVDIGSPKS